MSATALFFSVFGVIFIAELPDKTALATLVLATRQKASVVFAGSAAALALQSVIAVALGGVLSALPRTPVAIVTGIVFLGSAVVMWRKKDEAEPGAPEGSKPRDAATSDLRGFLRAFAVIFAAEWGDLTQVGTAALAARYGRPLVVLAGATLALWSVAGIAVFVGHRARRALDPTATRKVAAVLFGVVGIVVVAGAV
jgi:putative Ca2+/H+ antiporter (TMEM165/GDT1 family)